MEKCVSSNGLCMDELLTCYIFLFLSIPYYRNVCLFEFVCSVAVFSEQAIHAFIDSFSCFNHCLYHSLVFLGYFSFPYFNNGVFIYVRYFDCLVLERAIHVLINYFLSSASVIAFSSLAIYLRYILQQGSLLLRQASALT